MRHQSKCIRTSSLTAEFNYAWTFQRWFPFLRRDRPHWHDPWTAFGNGLSDGIPFRAMGTSQRYQATTNTKDQHGNVPSLITFSSRNHGRRLHTPCACFCASIALCTHIHSRKSRRPLAKVQISQQIKSFSRRSSWLDSHVSLKSLYGPNRRRSRRFSPLSFSPVLVLHEAERFTKPSTHVRDPHAPGGPPSRDANSET